MKTGKTIGNVLKVALVTMGSAWITVGQANAQATITWKEQGTITNENVIQANVSSAFNLWNVTANRTVTAGSQEVTFVSTASGSITSGGVTLTLTGFQNAGILVIADIWNGTATDADFVTVMDSFAHGYATTNPDNGTITLSGLTDGQWYSVQLFTSDCRLTIGDRRSIQFNDGAGNSTAQVAEIDKPYFIGTFRASGTTQAIGVTSYAISPGTVGGVVLNAVTLSIILPTPGTLIYGK